MNLNEKEHSRFIQRLDRTAEKNPFLWLPCVVLIALALAAEHIRDKRRNAENTVKSSPKLERKPLFLRAVAVTLTAALSLMLVPAAAFDAFADEYENTAGQTVFNETSETERISDPAEIAVPEEMTDPEEVNAPVETSEPEETAVPEEVNAPVETSEPEETAVPEEVNDPKETSEPEETAVPEEVNAPEETTVPEETSVPEEAAGPEEVFEPEDPEFPAEETALNEGIIPLDDHNHTFHMWEKSENEHWLVCTICKQEFDRSGHDFAIKVVNPTQTAEGSKTFTCTVCKYAYTKPLPTVSHDHKFTDTWSGDTDSHWHICINPNCEAIGSFADHSFGEWKSDGTYHWKECSVCNKSTRYTLHNFIWKNNADGHYRECTECGYSGAQNAHTFVTKYDGSNHWQECSNINCGYKKDEEKHDLTSTGWLTNSSRHWHGCPCGYSTESSSAAHNLQWSSDDDDVHWQYCTVCGWESAKVPHSLSWTHDDFGAFGQHWQECSCGYETGWDEHNFNDWEYNTNEDGHWYECADCRMKIDIEEHDYKWHFHDDEHWRECEMCGKITDEGDHLYKWKFNEEEHWEECVCGKKLSTEIHRFSTGVYTLDEDGETPVKRFYCTVCGYYYDVPIAHTHTPGDEWKHDTSDHWRECTSCGKPIDPEKHDLTAEVTVQPTEKEKGTRVYTCGVCDYSYSEAIPELEHVHAFGTEWKNDNAAHWHRCACGEKAAVERHLSDGGKVTAEPTASSEGLRVYTCTVCGYIIRTQTIPAIQSEPLPVYTAVYEATLRQPYITNSAEIKGWKDIAAYINASPDGAVIPITMNGTNEMPKDIARCIRNRNVTLNIYMDAGQVWTVNGLSVTALKTVDFCVSNLSNAIPQNVIDSIGSEIKPKEYYLFHSGDFGFSASLTLNIGNKYNGYYASLYHYDTVTKQLEFIDEGLVENSLVTFVLTHASYYVVSFSSIPLYDDMSAGAGAFDNAVPIETSAMPETDGVTIPPIKLPQIMKYSGKKRRYRILKKRRLDDLVFVL